MHKKKKNVFKNTLLSVRFQRRHRPKAVDQSQRSQPSPSGDGMSEWWPVWAPGFTVQSLNTCALFIYKGTFEMCGLWGWLIFVWKYIDVICFTRENIDLLLLLLLLLLLWHICISDARSLLVYEMTWRLFGAKPLPATIPQSRENWFKTQGYFTIKQNETNIHFIKYILFENKQEYKYYTECVLVISWTIDG